MYKFVGIQIDGIFLVKYAYIICSTKNQIRVCFILVRSKTENPEGLSVLQFAE
jgi:hypothetical protein